MTNILIQAGPGCGKTTTLAESYLYYKHPIKSMWSQRHNSTEQQLDTYKSIYAHIPGMASAPIYMAYNNDIVDDISKKVHGDCKVLTIHGWGYKIIRDRYGNIPINKSRNEILISKITNRDLNDLPDKWKWIATSRYVEKLKDELLPISEESFSILREKYDDLAPFKIHENMVEQASRLLIAMKEIDRRIGITFADQVWLAMFILAESGPKYEWGMCDESQDLSPARLRLVQMLCKHLIFCGDKNQAINAWNGADPYSMERIAETCQHSHSLTLSFRLVPNHAEFANRLKPSASLQSVPGKTAGRFERIEGEDTVAWAQEFYNSDTMVLCRYNAPLIKFGLALVKKGIAVGTSSSTLKSTLVDTVKNRNAKSMSELLSKLSTYESICMQGGDQFTKSNIKDKFDAIKYILQECTTIDQYYDKVNTLTNPRKNSVHIKLSTVHRAKGLEAQTIGILNPPLPSSRAITPVQLLQEENLNFVGHTRSKKDMFYLCQ
jgi:DNA helicase-2/ATP-dependent DNA helicase PcrA